MVDVWFDRGSFDTSYPDQRIDPRRTLQLAREAGFRCEDIPLTEQVLDLLDAAAKQARAEALRTVVSARETFAARFGHTPTWDLSFAVFPDAGAAARRLFEDGFAPTEGAGWNELAAAGSAGDTRAGSARFRWRGEMW